MDSHVKRRLRHQAIETNDSDLNDLGLGNVMTETAVSTPPPAVERPTPPWLFAIVGQSSGVMAGFATIVLPYVAVHKGLSVATAAVFVGASNLAAPLTLLWSPMLDMWWTLKAWLIAGAVMTTVMVAILFHVPVNAGNVSLLTALVFLTTSASQVATKSMNALLVLTVDKPRLSEASGYLQGGQLVMQGLSGAGGLWIAMHWGMTAATVFFAVLLAATWLAVLPIVEPPRMLTTISLTRRLVTIGREIVDMAKQPRRRWAMVSFLTPIGVGGASFLWAAVASQWHAGANAVALTTGLGAAGASALGAFMYGRFIGNLDRIVSFLATSSVLVLAALLLAALPREAAYFVAGTLLYSVALGFSWTSFSALQFETVGTGAVASKSALLNGFGNVPLVYMPIVLGVVHDHGSVTAMLLFEAVLTSAFIAVFAAVRPGRSDASVQTAQPQMAVQMQDAD